MARKLEARKQAIFPEGGFYYVSPSFGREPTLILKGLLPGNPAQPGLGGSHLLWLLPAAWGLPL